MKCIQLNSHQRLGFLPRDSYSKKDVAYLMTDRTMDACCLSQSLPLIVKWVNENVSSGEKWDRVSLTGLFENMNRGDKSANGGWHKGRYRITSMPLADCTSAFESARQGHKRAVIIGHGIQQATNCAT